MGYMVNFENLESIEKTLYIVSRNFYIKNVVQFGKTSFSNNARINGLRSRTYRSQKYSDIDRLMKLELETSDYLVFCCRSETAKKVNGNREYNSVEEIYISYPHMYKIITALKAVRKAVKDDAKKEFSEKIFIKSSDGTLSIGPKYDNYKKTISGLISGKEIAIFFDTIIDESIKEQPKYKKAITMIFCSSKFTTTIDMDTLDGLIYFLDNFNLVLSSQNLAQIGYMSILSKYLNDKNINEVDADDGDKYNLSADYTGGTVNNMKKIKGIGGQNND